MALLCGRAGRLTAKNGEFRPGQVYTFAPCLATGLYRRGRAEWVLEEPRGEVAVPPLRRHSSALYRIRKRVRHLFLGASDAAAPSGGAPPRRAKRRRAGAGAAAAATAAAMI